MFTSCRSAIFKDQHRPAFLMQTRLDADESVVDLSPELTLLIFLFVILYKFIHVCAVHYCILLMYGYLFYVNYDKFSRF